MLMLVLAACAGLAEAWVSSRGATSTAGMQQSTHQGIQRQLRHAVLSSAVAVISVGNLVFAVIVRPGNVPPARAAVLWFVTFLPAMLSLHLQRQVLTGRTSHAATAEATFDYSLPPVHNARQDDVDQLALMDDLGERELSLLDPVMPS
jgi:hypothetical protein